jgi:hypothetical protein
LDFESKEKSPKYEEFWLIWNGKTHFGTLPTFFYIDIIELNLLGMFIKYRMKPEIISSLPEHVLSVISTYIITVHGISVCGRIMS